jgi:hypothetical protein
VIPLRQVSRRRHVTTAILDEKSRSHAGTSVAHCRIVLRALSLSLLLTGCISSNGRVNVAATTGVWGGAMIVGGAALGAGVCEPSDEQCDRVEHDPAAAAALIVGGAALLGLAYLFHHQSGD